MKSKLSKLFIAMSLIVLGVLTISCSKDNTKAEFVKDLQVSTKWPASTGKTVMKITPEGEGAMTFDIDVEQNLKPLKAIMKMKMQLPQELATTGVNKLTGNMVIDGDNMLISYSFIKPLLKSIPGLSSIPDDDYFNLTDIVKASMPAGKSPTDSFNSFSKVQENEKYRARIIKDFILDAKDLNITKSEKDGKKTYEIKMDNVQLANYYEYLMNTYMKNIKEYNDLITEGKTTPEDKTNIEKAMEEWNKPENQNKFKETIEDFRKNGTGSSLVATIVPTENDVDTVVTAVIKGTSVKVPAVPTTPSTAPAPGKNTTLKFEITSNSKKADSVNIPDVKTNNEPFLQLFKWLMMRKPQ